MTFETCLEVVAPYYNLALVAIVVFMFIALFKTKNKKVDLLSWKILFFIVIIYIIEQVLTVLFNLGLIIIPRITNAVFELVIITVFIYVLLIQIELLKK